MAAAHPIKLGCCHGGRKRGDQKQTDYQCQMHMQNNHHIKLENCTLLAHHRSQTQSHPQEHQRSQCLELVPFCPTVRSWFTCLTSWHIFGQENLVIPNESTTFVKLMRRREGEGQWGLLEGVLGLMRASLEGIGPIIMIIQCLHYEAINSSALPRPDDLGGCEQKWYLYLKYAATNLGCSRMKKEPTQTITRPLLKTNRVHFK